MQIRVIPVVNAYIIDILIFINTDSVRVAMSRQPLWTSGETLVSAQVLFMFV